MVNPKDKIVVISEGGGTGMDWGEDTQRKGGGKVMLGQGEEAEVVEEVGRELQRTEQA